jgi:hypothetical protein
MATSSPALCAKFLSCPTIAISEQPSLPADGVRPRVLEDSEPVVKGYTPYQQLDSSLACAFHEANCSKISQGGQLCVRFLCTGTSSSPSHLAFPSQRPFAALPEDVGSSLSRERRRCSSSVTVRMSVKMQIGNSRVTFRQAQSYLLSLALSHTRIQISSSLKRFADGVLVGKSRLQIDWAIEGSKGAVGAALSHDTRHPGEMPCESVSVCLLDHYARPMFRHPWLRGCSSDDRSARPFDCHSRSCSMRASAVPAKQRVFNTVSPIVPCLPLRSAR